MNAEEKQQIEIIEKANKANNILYGDVGEILRETANRQVELALRKLCFEVLNERQRDVLIERIRYLKYKLFDELNRFSEEGEDTANDLEDKMRTPEPLFG